MKTTVITAASLAVLALGAAAAPAAAETVRIRDAVARVAVVVEDRTDVAVEVEQGSSGLPAIKVTRHGDEVRIDGDLGRNAIRNCHSGSGEGRQSGEGASVEVRDRGRIDVSTAPLIVIRTPRNVDVEAGGAVFGSVGRGATSAEVGTVGCGGWTVANVDGPLSVAIGGSGTIRTGTSRSLEVSIGGSGDVMTAGTGEATVNIGGSGDVTIASINGDFEASIGGSGNVTVRGGRAGRFEASIAGSGDVDFRGPAASAEVNLMGGGDVRIASVSGAVERNIMGGGRLTIGAQ